MFDRKAPQKMTPLNHTNLRPEPDQINNIDLKAFKKITSGFSGQKRIPTRNSPTFNQTPVPAIPDHLNSASDEGTTSPRDERKPSFSKSRNKIET